MSVMLMEICAKLDSSRNQPIACTCLNFPGAPLPRPEGSALVLVVNDSGIGGRVRKEVNGKILTKDSKEEMIKDGMVEGVHKIP